MCEWINDEEKEIEYTAEELEQMKMEAEFDEIISEYEEGIVSIYIDNKNQEYLEDTFSYSEKLDLDVDELDFCDYIDEVGDFMIAHYEDNRNKIQEVARYHEYVSEHYKSLSHAEKMAMIDHYRKVSYELDPDLSWVEYKAKYFDVWKEFLRSSYCGYWTDFRKRYR